MSPAEADKKVDELLDSKTAAELVTKITRLKDTEEIAYLLGVALGRLKQRG